MDNAPLPPHERSWRHPSELGPPEHEPTTAGGRALIVTTATLGLLLVGVLAISMTPDRSDTIESAASTISGLRTAPATVAALERPTLPMVTPLGDDGWGVTTMSAVAGRSGLVNAQLPTGAEVRAEIVGTDRSTGLAVVSIPPSAGYDLARSEPMPSDTVLVRSDPPVVVTMVELARLEVGEATPVLDDHGDLIGLCAREDDRIALRTIDTMPVNSTATTTPTTPPQPTRPPTTATSPTTTTTTPTTATTAPPTTATTTAPTTAAQTTVVPAGGPVTSSGAGAAVSDAGVATTGPG